MVSLTGCTSCLSRDVEGVVAQPTSGMWEVIRNLDGIVAACRDFDMLPL